MLRKIAILPTKIGSVIHYNKLKYSVEEDKCGNR